MNICDSFQEHVNQLQGDAQIEYMLSAAPYIKEYFSKASGKQVFADYMTDVEKRDQATPALHDTERCAACKQNTVLDSRSGYTVCTSCGVAKPMLPESLTYSDEQELNVTSYYSYQRKNHFNELLAQLQGLETTAVPQDVIDTINKELKKNREDPASLTNKQLRLVLKRLGMSKHYENLNMIAHRVTGRQPPRLGAEQEDTLRNMFAAIQQPFEKHCPPTRKNFLSYNYCLYQFCAIMGYDDIREHFPLLKSKEKLKAHDEIWRRICDEDRAAVAGAPLLVINSHVRYGVQLSAAIESLRSIGFDMWSSVVVVIGGAKADAPRVQRDADGITRIHTTVDNFDYNGLSVLYHRRKELPTDATVVYVHDTCTFLPAFKGFFAGARCRPGDLQGYALPSSNIWCFHISLALEYRSNFDLALSKEDAIGLEFGEIRRGVRPLLAFAATFSVVGVRGDARDGGPRDVYGDGWLRQTHEYPAWGIEKHVGTGVRGAMDADPTLVRGSEAEPSEEIPMVMYKSGPKPYEQLTSELHGILERTAEDNPELSIEYFDDERCVDFIREHFSDAVLAAWHGLKPGAYKADLFRFCVLYIRGGIWSDLTQEFQVPIRSLVDSKTDSLVLVEDFTLFPHTIPGVQINFMATRPRNPIFLAAVTTIVRNVSCEYYGRTCLDPTGPYMFAYVVKKCGVEARVDLSQGERGTVVFRSDQRIAYFMHSKNHWDNINKTLENSYTAMWHARDVYKGRHR